MMEERTEHDEVALEKRAARSATRARVVAMSPTARAQASARVCQRVMALPEFAAARMVMMFAPLPDEVDLSDVLARCRELGKVVCAPRAGWKTRTLEPAEVRGRGWEGLVAARHGLREPGPDAPPVAPELIDMVLVPGAAFDAERHRLGRGGGFYDRFLARAELRRAFVVGVAFACQLVQRVPRSSHDRRVDAVITDDGIVLRRGEGEG